MTEREKPIDLTPLEQRYEIRGELRSADGARRFAARQRSNGSDVIVTVATGPARGASNALGLYASDARLLAGVAHPLVSRVVDAEWVGPNEFAVVSERIEGPSLRDVLAREDLSTARIADILQDVHAAIGWAREIGVVHRTVTPDSLRFEERSGRPYVAFTPGEIPVNALPDACSDARTVGVLARMMLAGSPDAAHTMGNLTAIRTDLAERVAAEVDEMCTCEAGGHTPDVGAFLASIAMNDALKAGEVERARVQSELAEADRSERERWQAREREIEQREAEHRRRLAEERAQFERQLADERAAFEKRMLQEQRRLEAERSRLEMRRIPPAADAASVAGAGAALGGAAAAGKPVEPVDPVPRPVAPARTEIEIAQDESQDDGPAVVPVPGRARPAWAVPALTVALLVLVMALVSGLSRRGGPTRDAGLPVYEGTAAGTVDPAYGGTEPVWPETYRATPPAPEQPDPLYTVPSYTPPSAYTPPMYPPPSYVPPPTEEPRRPIAEPVWSPPRAADTPAPSTPAPAEPPATPEPTAPAPAPDTARPAPSAPPRDTATPAPVPSLTPRLTPRLPPGIEIRPIPVPVIPPPDTSARP